MAAGDDAGTMLCGVTVEFNDVVQALITGCTNMGAERASVPNIHNDVIGGWADVLYSCIVRNKPFRLTFVFKTNDATWIANMKVVSNFIITWPIVQGFTTGGTLSWAKCGITDYMFGSPDIEGRINAEATFTPAGLPVVVAGDVDA